MNHETEELAELIRRNTNGSEPVQTTLAANQRIIARVTDGIYREPWAAFRELIANAYDADASHVVVETGAPEFDQITVRDDGIGMSPDTVAYIVRNIGASSKRRHFGTDLHTVRPGALEYSPAGRPLIGKIGIGLFAVAQLTQHFQIITKAQHEDSRISATVRLRTHNDATQPDDDDYIAGSVAIRAETVPEADIDTHGTSVVLYSLRPEVRRTLQTARRWEAVVFGEPGNESYQPPPVYHIGRPEIPGADRDAHVTPKLPWQQSAPPDAKFTSFVEAAGDTTGRTTKPADLDHFDEYLKLLWKLSLSLPLEYPDEHPFDRTAEDGLILLTVRNDQRQATSVDLGPRESIRAHLDLQSGTPRATPPFAVTLDGIALGRPLQHTATLAKASRVGAPILLAARQRNPFSNEDLERAGGPLSFEAYLYWNSKLKPKDISGVLVRIREASGTLFDPTFLNYQVSEQTRLRQITGEIYVHDGLDSAINIDRESFNYSHPHFLYLQRWLHRALRLLVNRIKAIAKEDLDREKATKQIEAQTALLAKAQAIWRRRLGDDADPPFDLAVDRQLPLEVGNAEMEWSRGDFIDSPTERSALSVILEAYGILSSLPHQDRAEVIRDVLSVFGSSK